MKPKGDLGPLERSVMDCIWDAGEPMTVRDVMEMLANGRPLAYTTVMTVMNRLSRKGLLKRRRVGRTNVYEARRSRDEHAAQVVGEVLRRATDRRSVLLGFVRSVDESELVELRRAIRQVERERKESDPS